MWLNTLFSKNNSRFLFIFLACIISSFIFRTLESLLIIIHHGYHTYLLLSEFIGFIFDSLIFGTFLVIIFPVYYLIAKISTKLASISILSLISLLLISHQLILRFFLYELAMLDTFIFEYSKEEMLYTLNTTSVNYSLIATIILFCILCLILSYAMLRKKEWTSNQKVFLNRSLLISPLLFIIFYFYLSAYPNHFTHNKSVYFYSQVWKYFNREATIPIDLETAITEYQALYPQKQFTDRDFPFLHQNQIDSNFQQLFTKFESKPNIVLLIVEGLNDDFIHEYKGVQLMPFLDSLKQKSLYWNSCLTLGERSYAVVPSTLGSLPYGKRGFTIPKKAIDNMNLISILKANNYFTTFFYGQPAWFHNKRCFFNYNDIDLIIDNSNYPAQYDSIIVEEQNYFWGYNDKDLLRHSLEVIDGLPKQSRLDIYFTGSMHSLFRINDEAYYQHKFQNLISKADKKNRKFLEQKKKYIKTILFTNDALKAFFDSYQARNEFTETVFIITGDHPMTELPRQNSLKKYHVPLIIYSDKLKQAQVFPGICSHLDLYESILSLLDQEKLHIPKHSHAIGSHLNLTKEMKGNYAFMNGNRNLVEYYSNGIYLSKGQLYQVNSNLNLEALYNDKLKQKMQRELDVFRKLNSYVCNNNHLIPSKLFHQEARHHVLSEFKLEHDSIQTDKTYFSIIPNTIIKNKTHHLDLRFESGKQKTEDLFLVWQICDQKGNNLLWESTGFPEEPEKVNFHFRIPPQNTCDSSLIFTSYLWNRENKDCILHDFKAILYQN